MKRFFIINFFIVVFLFSNHEIQSQIHRSYPDSTYLFWEPRGIAPYHYYQASAHSNFTIVTAFNTQDHGNSDSLILYGVGLPIFYEWLPKDETPDSVYFTVTIFDVPKFPLVKDAYIDTMLFLGNRPPDVYLTFPPIYDTVRYPIYEFYYEQPKVVRGDFLIGLRTFPRQSLRVFNPVSSTSIPRWNADTNNVRGYVGVLGSDTIVREILAHGGLYGYANNNPNHYTPFGGTPEQDSIFNATFKTDQGPMAYPILRPYSPPPVVVEEDTIPPCNEIEDFRLAYQGGDTVIFLWHRTGNGSYQISYGPAGNNTEDNNLEDFSDFSSFLRYTGFEDGLYKASVRGKCNHSCAFHGDTTLYTAWSAPIYFRFGEDTTTHDTISIYRVPQTATVRLLPNPASTAVTIQSDEYIQSVSVFDVSGKNVWEQVAPLNLSKIELDVALWTKGVYLVIVTTLSQKTILKLVVN